MKINTILSRITQENQHIAPWSSDLSTATILKFLIQIYSPRSILELGTFLGYGTLSMLEVAPSNSKIYTVDVLNNFLKYYKQLNQIDKKRILFLNQSTDQALSSSLSHVSFDFIFVDADHLFKSILRDTRNSLKLCKSGTIIVLHDTELPGFPGVKYVVNILKVINYICFSSLFDSFSFRTKDIKQKDFTGLEVMRVKYLPRFIYNIINTIFICIDFIIPSQNPPTKEELMTYSRHR